MPGTAPTADLIWNEEITFFSIDTSVLEALSFQFNTGALNQLPNQLPSTMALHLTQIVAKESEAHYLRSVQDAVEKIRSGAKDIKRHTSVPMDEFDKSFERVDVLAAAEKSFRHDIEEYAERCSGSILPVTGLDGSKLFADYFGAKPPFEHGAKKKHEFPDAAALQLLQNHAELEDTCGIIVSKDNGWKNFAVKSSRLYYIDSIESLAALFVSTGEHPEKVKTKLLADAKDSESTLGRRIRESIEHNVKDADWDTSGLVAEFSGRVEADVEDAKMIRAEISDQIEAWSQRDDPSSWSVSLRADVSAEVHVDATFYVWDSVDREEVRLSSSNIWFHREIEVDIYLVCSNVGVDSPIEEWQISIDMPPGDYSLGSHSLELDSYHEDDA